MEYLLCCVFSLLAPAVFSAPGESPAITSEMAATAQKLMLTAQQGNKGYDIVSSLTTEVGPRPAGSAAEGRARQWAVDTFATLGFENIRIEAFTVPLWVRGVERADIVAPFPQSLTITALGGSAGTGPDGVEADVVAFATLAALQAATQERVQGKIVFVDEVMARSRDGSGYTSAVLKRRGTAFAAQRLGAKAALIRSVGTSSHRFAHTGQMRRIDYESATGVPTAALTGPDADQLQRALAYGKPVRVRLVLTPELLPPAPSGNVVAEIVGREAPEEVVLVAAHLDSWDQGTGAVDDAAGVGIVLGAATLLIEQLTEAPRRTIRVVLFGSEEVGLVGADAYAQQHANELSQHIVASESDFGAGDIWQFDTRVGEPGLAHMAAIAEVLQALDIAPGNNTARGGPDMGPLRKAGVPVVTLKQDGSDYFDLHHTPDDTLDKIAPGDLHQNVAAWAAFMYLAAETTADFR